MRESMDTPEVAHTRWLAVALWRTLHCYIGVLILFAALLGPYSSYCSRAASHNWINVSIGGVIVAAVPAVMAGSIATLAPPRVWKWMRLIFVSLAILFVILESTAPASWWAC